MRAGLPPSREIEMLLAVLEPATIWAPTISIQTQVRIADVSYYQGEIDFEAMRAALDGVIIRAGQRSWVDSKFKTNWARAKAAGLPRGSYWLYDSREDPRKQAALWWEQIQDDPGELVHVADLEESYGGPFGKPEHMRTLIEEFQRLSGLPDNRIAIYTGFYWWAARVGGDLYFKRFNLWLAWYAAMSIVRVPAPWSESDLLFWQYTSSGPGELYGVSSREIDLNWYSGTMREYSLRFGLGAPAPEPQPTGVNMQGTVKSTVTRGLNVRDVVGNVVAALWFSSPLQRGDVVYGEVRSDNRIYFSKIYRANGMVEQLGGLCSATVRDGTSTYMDLANVAEPGADPAPDPDPAPTPAHVVEVIVDGVSVFRQELP